MIVLSLLKQKKQKQKQKQNKKKNKKMMVTAMEVGLSKLPTD
jgi:hypothetical protein